MTRPSLKPVARRREHWQSIAEVPILFRLPALEAATESRASQTEDGGTESAAVLPPQPDARRREVPELVMRPVRWLRKNAQSIGSTVLILAAALAVLIIRDRHRASPPERPAARAPDTSRHTSDEPTRTLWPERRVPETARGATDRSRAAVDRDPDGARLAEYPRDAVRLSTGPRDGAPHYDPVESLPTQMPSGVRLLTPTSRESSETDAPPLPSSTPYHGSAAGAGPTASRQRANTYSGTSPGSSNHERTGSRLY